MRKFDLKKWFLAKHESALKLFGEQLVPGVYKHLRKEVHEFAMTEGGTDERVEEAVDIFLLSSDLLCKSLLEAGVPMEMIPAKAEEAINAKMEKNDKREWVLKNPNEPVEHQRG